VHAWVTLGAAAMVTERIRLGTLLTPASRWRPWDLASAVATVDRLSGGRVVMSVGLGALHRNWLAFEPGESRRVRAEKLDECLAVYDGLIRGQPFTYEGKHYSARAAEELVPAPPASPMQRPRPHRRVHPARPARAGRMGSGGRNLVGRELVDNRTRP
jgi:alkanesulfonate monooxygenase SsuD/methylene tetrahydromethanopterin reductase-like flavin-dependent oxidoreductase (luciferase family)